MPTSVLHWECEECPPLLVTSIAAINMIAPTGCSWSPATLQELRRVSGAEQVLAARGLGEIFYSCVRGAEVEAKCSR